MNRAQACLPDADRPQVAAVIVAHPDDETLWAGGLLLAHPQWRWRVITLCRAGDADRAPRFHRVLAHIGASGAMGDLDDGPGQARLSLPLVMDTIRRLLPPDPYNLVLTHGPRGEYTRHRRHEEVSLAVRTLWGNGEWPAARLGMFAYQDDGPGTLPRARPKADLVLPLPDALWQQKYRLITQIYGFAPESWEARATPPVEAFWCFASPASLGSELRKRQESTEANGSLNENPADV